MKALISVIVIGIPIYFFVLATISQARAAEGLQENQLTACSSKPNCVCSECEKPDEHYVEPVVLSEFENEKVIQLIKNTLKAMGGDIVTETDVYIAATFTSTLFRFVDDFEIRIDAPGKTVHVRSASRVGYSDFGVNRKRVEKFRTLLEN